MNGVWKEINPHPYSPMYILLISCLIEPKFTSDGIKREFRYEFPKAIEAWIFLLIKWDDNQKTSLFHTEQVDIKSHRPK